MFGTEQQLTRLVHVQALSALLRETKNLDMRHKIRSKLKEYAFPEEIQL